LYIEALKKEFEHRLPKLGPISAPSIYFGGGTPSLLTGKGLKNLFDSLSRWVKWNKQAEITLEANPETINKTLAKDWKMLGVNRVSLGAQSFNSGTLKKLGRTHTPKNINHSAAILKEQGHQNINLDLIYGLPNESSSDFNSTIQAVSKLGPSHISLYQLAIEEKTRFYLLNKKNVLALPSDEETSLMYENALLVFKKAGFNHYELQNFSKPGFESIHNLRYWKHLEFLGFGVGAYSYINGKRFGHTKILSSYLKNSKKDVFDPAVTENITPKIALKEKIILGLRLKEGIDLNQFEKEGFEIPKTTLHQLKQLSNEGLLIKKENTYQSTLQGQHLSETVAARLV